MPAVKRPPNSPVGALVTSDSAPPSVLRPNSVPCGPFSTSMRSMSNRAGVQALGLAQRDAVDIDADAAVARGLVLIVGDDAADADRQRGLARFERRDAQRRHGAVGEVEQALDVTVGQCLGAEHADRDRRFLEVGRTLVAVTTMSARPSPALSCGRGLILRCGRRRGAVCASAGVAVMASKAPPSRSCARRREVSCMFSGPQLGALLRHRSIKC